MKYPNSLQQLIESFQMYPGVGPKTAERMALFTILNVKEDRINQFSNNLIAAKSLIKFCNNCGMLTEDEHCDICLDDERENKIMVVEGTKDAIAVEKTKTYIGRYHILNGLISPLEGVGPNDLNINKLARRIEDEQIDELIIATNATIEGETTALYIAKIFADTPTLVTRIGYGLPAGGDIEYADEITLIRSLEGRKKL